MIQAPEATTHAGHNHVGVPRQGMHLRFRGPRAHQMNLQLGINSIDDSVPNRE